MFLLGFHPVSINFPYALVISISIAEPEFGSVWVIMRRLVRVVRHLTCSSPNNPGVAVITDNDGFVRIGAVDDANDVPDGRGRLLHFIG